MTASNIVAMPVRGSWHERRSCGTIRDMDIIEAIKSGDRSRAAELLTADPGIAEGRTPEGVSYIALAMYHRQPDIASLLAARETIWTSMRPARWDTATASGNSSWPIRIW